MYKKISCEWVWNCNTIYFLLPFKLVSFWIQYILQVGIVYSSFVQDDDDDDIILPFKLYTSAFKIEKKNDWNERREKICILVQLMHLQIIHLKSEINIF